MGGRMVLLSLDDKEELKALVEDGKEWLSQWFEEVRPWTYSKVCAERYAWLCCKAFYPVYLGGTFRWELETLNSPNPPYCGNTMFREEKVMSSVIPGTKAGSLSSFVNDSDEVAATHSEANLQNTLLDDVTFNGAMGTNDGTYSKEAEDVLQTLSLNRPSMTSLKIGPLNSPEHVGNYLIEWSFPSPAQVEADHKGGPCLSPSARQNAEDPLKKPTTLRSRNKKKEFPCSVVYERIIANASIFKSASEQWGNKSPLFLPCPKKKAMGNVIEDGDIANMNKE
ncbi:hypothetical protein Ancab_015412 [Ancistrocladus abbreviatus]